jgi:hypothetical protein
MEIYLIYAWGLDSTLKGKSPNYGMTAIIIAKRLSYTHCVLGSVTAIFPISLSQLSSEVST